MALALANADVVMGTAAGPIVSPGMGQNATILRATATNFDGATHTLTLYRVPNGQTASTSNLIGADAVPLLAGETITLPLSGHTLVAQQQLQGLADTAGFVVVNVSYTLTS